jgi:hypothetical protein
MEQNNKGFFFKPTNIITSHRIEINLKTFLKNLNVLKKPHGNLERKHSKEKKTKDNMYQIPLKIQ